MVNVGKYTIHGSYGSVHTATPEMLGVGSPGILGSTTILHREVIITPVKSNVTPKEKVDCKTFLLE